MQSSKKFVKFLQLFVPHFTIFSPLLWCKTSPGKEYLRGFSSLQRYICSNEVGEHACFLVHSIRLTSWVNIQKEAIPESWLFQGMKSKMRNKFYLVLLGGHHSCKRQWSEKEVTIGEWYCCIECSSHQVCYWQTLISSTWKLSKREAIQRHWHHVHIMKFLQRNFAFSARILKFLGKGPNYFPKFHVTLKASSALALIHVLAPNTYALRESCFII